MNNDKSESDQCKAENSEMGKISLITGWFYGKNSM